MVDWVCIVLVILGTLLFFLSFSYHRPVCIVAVRGTRCCSDMHTMMLMFFLYIAVLHIA